MAKAEIFDLLGERPGPVLEHPGMQKAYNPDNMTIGAIAPLEGFVGPVPTMERHVELVQQAEAAGIAQYWVRDIPLLDPTFGDTGQVFDPFVYLGYLAAVTDSIVLGVASSVLPLRHPLDIAKAAATVDQLTGGRFTLGIASGDRPVEFPAYGKDHAERGEVFRQSVKYLQEALGSSFPKINSPLGRLEGADLIPKPVYQKVPLFVTGSSRQNVDWIAQMADGWLFYTVPLEQQQLNIRRWRRLTGSRGEPGWKPFNQAIYIDLAESPVHLPRGIHQGLQVGREPLLELLHAWQGIGVDQLMINFKQSKRPVADVLSELKEYILPHFPPGSVPSEGVIKPSSGTDMGEEL